MHEYAFAVAAALAALNGFAIVPAFLLILLVCLGIVVGVLAAIFKTPSIALSGLNS